jgi:hypothetical protein
VAASKFHAAIAGPSAAGAGRLPSRLFLRIELTEVKERAPIANARSHAASRRSPPYIAYCPLWVKAGCDCGDIAAPQQGQRFRDDPNKMGH